MRKRNNPRESDADTRFSANLSSGQLVIAISVSLFVMLTCFLIGVLVGKYDSSLDQPRSDASDALPGGAPPASPIAGQTTPRPMAAVSRPVSPRTPEPPPPATPRVVDLAPLPAENAGTPAAEDAEDVARVKPRERVPAWSEANVPAAETSGDQASPRDDAPEAAPADAPRLVLDPIPVTDDLVPEAAAPAATPVAAAPEPLPAPRQETGPAQSVAVQVAATPGAYGVQMVSLMGDDRARKAREVQTTLKDKYGLESTVLIQQNGARYAVVVVGFDTQAAATAERDRLRRETPYKDCFVRNL